MYSLTLLTLLPFAAAFNSSTPSACLPLPSTALSTIVFFKETTVTKGFLRPSPVTSFNQSQSPVVFFNNTLPSDSLEKRLLKAPRVVPVDQRHLARFSEIRAPSRKFLAVPPKKSHTFHFGKEVPVLAILSFVTVFIASVCLFCTLIQLWELELLMEEVSQEIEEEETTEEEYEEEEDSEEKEWEEARESDC